VEPKGFGAATPAVVDGVIYVSAGARMVALDRKGGHVRGEFRVGGHIGPAPPLLGGKTLLITNLYGWVQAFPISAFKPVSARQ